MSLGEMWIYKDAMRATPVYTVRFEMYEMTTGTDTQEQCVGNAKKYSLTGAQ